MKRCLVTGAAGFIGSHLVEALLLRDKEVVGFDNLSTGSQSNLDAVRCKVSEEQWTRFSFSEADLRDEEAVQQACSDVDTVFHLAAMASVPQSIAHPRTAHEVNVSGFLNVFLAAREAGAKAFVFASSSAIYGDCRKFPIAESEPGSLLSPYAATKRINENYAECLSVNSQMRSVGMRFFNVYGPRQTCKGPYASVIPLWIEALRMGKPPVLFGDGSATRCFIYVRDVVDACLLAAEKAKPGFHAYNIAASRAISLKDLYPALRSEVARHVTAAGKVELSRQSARAGDIVRSEADTSLFEHEFGFKAATSLDRGLAATVSDTVSTDAH